jgi:hypothetical protein
MFEFQSVRRSFPRNLAENSEAASFLDQTTSFETEVQEREPFQSSISQFEFLFEQLSTIKLFQCFHIQMVVVPFLRNNPSTVMFFSGLYFPPKHSGKNIWSALGFFIAGNPFVKNPGFPFLHFRLI